MRIDPFGTSWLSNVGNWFVDAGKAIGKFVENNWDIIVGVGITAGLAALSIATFGILPVVVGVGAGAVFGAGFGMLSAAVAGDDVLYGAISGFISGALGGLGGGLGILSAGFGAATLSLIGDRVNDRKRNFTKALVSGFTATIFAGLNSSATSYLIDQSKELAIKMVVETFGAISFSSYNLITDIIIDSF